MSAGYELQPQVWVGRSRLGMVVRSRGAQVGIECDGDRHHGFEKIGDDLARQAVLERVGWRFVRIRGSRYFRDPKATMTQVRARLHSLGVTPALALNDGAAANEACPLRDQIIRSAWEIMRQQGWLGENDGIAALGEPDDNEIGSRGRDVRIGDAGRGTESSSGRSSADAYPREQGRLF